MIPKARFSKIPGRLGHVDCTGVAHVFLFVAPLVKWSLSHVAIKPVGCWALCFLFSMQVRTALYFSSFRSGIDRVAGARDQGPVLWHGGQEACESQVCGGELREPQVLLLVFDGRGPFVFTYRSSFLMVFQRWGGACNQIGFKDPPISDAGSYYRARSPSAVRVSNCEWDADSQSVFDETRYKDAASPTRYQSTLPLSTLARPTCEGRSWGGADQVYDRLDESTSCSIVRAWVLKTVASSLVCRTHPKSHCAHGWALALVSRADSDARPHPKVGYGSWAGVSYG
jgi:hypothetical protein